MDLAGMQTLWAKMPLAEAVVQVFRYVGDDRRLQAIFDRERGRCYDDVIRFPDLVRLIADALLEHGGSGNQSFSRAQETGALTASKVAAYGKLGRLPLSLSQAFLAELTRDLRGLFPTPARRRSPDSLRGFSTIVLDGKAIKKVAKWLKRLRRIGGGLLGSRALAALTTKPAWSSACTLTRMATPMTFASFPNSSPGFVRKSRALCFWRTAAFVICNGWKKVQTEETTF